MHNTLLHLFPTAKPGDWMLQDDGAGPYIRTWNRAEAQPTAAQLAAVSVTAEFATLKHAEFDIFRGKREEFINRMTWIASDFAALKTVSGDAAAANARAISNFLLDMLTDPPIVAATDIVSLKWAMKVRYRAITYPTTVGGFAMPEVVAAYRKVDL